MRPTNPGARHAVRTLMVNHVGHRDWGLKKDEVHAVSG